MQGKATLAYLALTLSLITISARATNNMLLTTLPPFARYVLRLSNIDVGLLMATVFVSTFVATTLLNPILGRWTRTAFVTSNMFIFLSMFLFYLSSSLTVWIISALTGFASGLVFPNMITAASAAKDARSVEQLLAIYTTGLSASLVAGPLFETWLLGFIGYREVFLPFSAVAFVAALTSFYVRFPQISGRHRRSLALLSKGFLASVLSNATYAVPFAAITTFLVIYASERFGVSKELAYFAFIPFFSVSFATRLLIALFPRRSLLPAFISSASITIAALLAFDFVNTYPLFLLLSAALGYPHGSIYPMSTIIIARSTPVEMRGAVNSYFSATGNLIFITVPVIVGYISHYIGLGTSFLMLCLPVIATFSVFLIKYGRDSMLLSVW